MAKYQKAVASIVAAVMIAVVPILNSGPMTVVSELNIGIAFLSACSIYLIPNFPQAPALKTSIAALMAGVAFLVTAVDTKCSSLLAILHCVAVVNWIQCGIMVLKAGGVYLIPNDDSGSGK